VFPAGNAGTQCRASAGICDPAESCDGVNVNCPANQFDKTTTCSAPSCTNGTGTLAAVCNGSGASCPTAVQKACDPYTCGATACLTTCAADTDCTPGNYCAVGGKCTPKGTIGASCSAGVQCLSSFCTDGVCCNSDCSNQCEACNLPTSAGTCAAVQGKPVGSRAACPGNGTGCDGFCNGALRTSCTLPGQNTECRPASCDASMNTATLREFCDGQGSCPSKRTQDCTPGICGATQCTGCSTNADCPKGDFCRGGVCKPLASNGTACSIDPECSSSHCVDGVCCDNDCTGQCEACNLPGTPGTCTAIAAGQPPATGRPQCNGTGTQCGGTCDGTNRRACVYAGPGTVCRDADCQNSVATLVGFCDGAGACPALDQIKCPTGSKCVGTICSGGPNTCSSDGDCNVNEYCAAGACAQKKQTGTTCNIANECNSSICVDGVCCSSACTGQCEACNLVGNEGSCLPVTGAPQGGRQPCASDGSVCAGECDGVANDRCAYKGADTSCRDAACHGGLADVPATCQGNGSCAPLQQQSCDPVGCDAEGITCAGPCKADSDCMTGQYCSASMCVAKLGNGSPCGGSNQCTNGHCVDGVCCDGACTGQCQSCDQAGSVGTCTAVPGTPRDGRPACAGSGACGGYCDGMDGTTCVLPDANTTCGIEYCSESADTKAPKCNGSATCVIPAPLSCDPYRCDPQGSTCRTSCDTDTDCAPGLVCNNGDCSQPVVVPDAGVKKTDAGIVTMDASIGAGGASAGGASSADGGSRGDGGSSNNGAGGRSGTAGTGTSGKAGSFGIPSPDGGVIVPVDAGVDGGARAGGKHNNEHDTGGCGCRVTSTGTPDGIGELALLALAATLLRRRRRARELPDPSSVRST
jgi:MYXO-CTERM domain-containing protein